MITLPSTAPADLFATTGTIISDIWGLIALAVGIPLAVFVIELLIGIISPESMTQYTREELEDAAHGIKK
jgi:hypothetical protein